ncbi:dihydrolipoyl dehydrogenase [Gracilinema caldarium]|uniref:Dihydrolipoyl dehydrogenase n=1 Tax=Gracilinema caldarium (strain ATCC 51460 / DSM 7334 / H1) TaxID=744872 RepID=F8F203_GRAC1|nr:dihydrolipoyl dehydrogenase [Gracilinema caldarium]AEJ19850.1 dihydrolipoamide dehydrogenase [Gracilinema caldarium DSM 7334]
MQFDYDILFIGAGPAGYVGAIRASQLGLKTAVVERDKLGGVCLNIGCIPSKALIEQATRYSVLEELAKVGVTYDTTGFDYSKVQAFSRTAAEKLSKGVDFLLKKNKVDIISGTASFIDKNTLSITDGEGKEYKKVSAYAIVIATGSRPRLIPGFEFDETKVISSTGALMMKDLPQRLIILGAGAIGMEFAYIMNSFGVEVTMVEMLDRILPMEDADVSSAVKAVFEKRGVRFYTGMKAVRLEKTDSGGLRLIIEPAQIEGSPQQQEKDRAILEGDRLLVSTGRSPNTENLGLDKLGIQLDRGYIQVHDYYETDAQGLYAVGDIVAGEAQLAHVASAQAEVVAERVAYVLGKGPNPHLSRIDKHFVPQAVYCEPQNASFGFKEAELQKQGLHYKSSTFPFRAIGKAVATGHPEGFVKLLTDPATGEILGASVLGSGATDLIHELLLASQNELTAEEVAAMIHAHPTLAEGVKEGALSALDRAIHL